MSNQQITHKPFGINEGLVSSLNEAMTLGELASQSGMFPDITSKAKAVMIILAGQEIGVPPMAALRGMYVQKGKVEFHAGLLAALIQASQKYEYRVRKHDDTICVLEWFKNHTSEGMSQFSIEDAKRARLIKPDSNWEKFPRAMLFARALTAGQRTYAPDIAIGAVYAPGEISDDGAIEVETDRPSFTNRPGFASLSIDEKIGEFLREAKLSDHDVAIKQIADGLRAGAFQAVAQYLKQPVERILEEFGNIPVEPSPTDNINVIWLEHESGIPKEPEQVMTPAEQEIATQHAEMRQKYHPPPELQRRHHDPLQSSPAVVVAPDVRVEIKPADPVPGLKPTLTPAQQKVSDAVSVALKEHKKDKATVLHLIGQYLGRKVERSGELDDDEAEKVFNYLQTLGSQWSDERECEEAIANDEV